MLKHALGRLALTQAPRLPARSTTFENWVFASWMSTGGDIRIRG